MTAAGGRDDRDRQVPVRRRDDSQEAGPRQPGTGGDPRAAPERRPVPAARTLADPPPGPSAEVAAGPGGDRPAGTPSGPPAAAAGDSTGDPASDPPARPAAEVVVDIRGLAGLPGRGGTPDAGGGLGAVAALARMRLAARRTGYRVRLRGASPEVRRLLELTGLAAEFEWEPEEGEEPGGVQE